MTRKINLGILFGGRSCEHEVSVTSSRSVLKAIDSEKFDVHLVGIDKSGHWHLTNDIDVLAASGSVEILEQDGGESATPVSMALHNQGNLTPDPVTGSADSRAMTAPSLDVIFPVLHGTFGEDGTLQGVLEMAGIPYVGCGVAASALAMDKALAKKVFAAAGIPQAAYLVVRMSEWEEDNGKVLDQVEEELGYPNFVKPANLGSSVGINKAHDREGLVEAIEYAFEFDTKIVIEESMENCHEVECAILGNDHPQASILGEIIPGAEFYNYETKYIDDKSELVVPAPLDEKTTARVQQIAIDSFKAIDGSGLARVDFFVHRESNEVFLNEVNTLPGFTPISMYPRLWAESGIPYAELINRLIELAIEKHQSRQSLKRSY